MHQKKRRSPRQHHLSLQQINKKSMREKRRRSLGQSQLALLSLINKKAKNGGRIRRAGHHLGSFSLLGVLLKIVLSDMLSAEFELRVLQCCLLL
jgi:hypothetical protein